MECGFVLNPPKMSHNRLGIISARAARLPAFSIFTDAFPVASIGEKAVLNRCKICCLFH